MDDAPRAHFLKTVSIVGFLVLTGAGCAKMTVQEPTAQVEVPQVKQETQKPSEDLYVDIDKVCFRNFSSWDNFTSTLKKYGIVGVEPKISEKIQKDFQNGWSIHRVCIIPEHEVAITTFAFVMIKTKGVTESEAEGIVRTVSFKDEELNSSDFTNSAFWSLMKFEYFGPMNQDNSLYGETVSELFAVNGGPNQLGYLEHLSIARDVEDPLQNLYLKAQTSGGDVDSYYADIEYRPKGNDLKFRVCQKLNIGEDLGEKTSFSCK